MRIEDFSALDVNSLIYFVNVVLLSAVRHELLAIWRGQGVAQRQCHSLTRGTRHAPSARNMALGLYLLA